MPTYHFETLDVFTSERFGGNPLAVFPEASGLTDRQVGGCAWVGGACVPVLTGEAMV